jgi:hypothetical protein
VNKIQFCCKDFEKAVDANIIIDENTFAHSVNCNSVKLDGWYLGQRTYQQSIRDCTYEQVGKKLNYCPYCGTKLEIGTNDE